MSNSNNNNTTTQPPPPPHINVQPKPIQNIAYINEHGTSTNVPVNDVLSMQIPSNIPYNTIYPIHAPSDGSIIDQLQIRKNGGYQPGGIYMRQVTEKEMPYTMKEQRLKHTINKIFMEQKDNNSVGNQSSISTTTLFKSVIQSTHDIERNQRKVYLKSLQNNNNNNKPNNSIEVESDEEDNVDDIFNSDNKKEIQTKLLKEKKKRLQLLNGALQQLQFASQALKFVLTNSRISTNDKNNNNKRRSQQGILPVKLYNTSKRPLIDRKYLKPNLTNAIIKKKSQLDGITKIFQQKAENIASKVQSTNSYNKRLALLANEWTLKCKNRAAFTPLRANDKLSIDCSNIIYGSLYRCENEKTMEMLEASTMAEFKMKKNDSSSSSSSSSESTIALQVPKTCSFVTIQIYVNEDVENKYTLPISKVTIPSIDVQTCHILNTIRHSIFCEELFKNIYNEASHIISLSASTFNQKTNETMKHFQISEISDDIITIRLNEFGTITIALVRAGVEEEDSNTTSSTTTTTSNKKKKRKRNDSNNTNNHFLLSKNIADALKGNIYGIWARNKRINEIVTSSSPPAASPTISNVVALIQHYTIRESISLYVKNSKFNMEIDWNNSLDDLTLHGNQILLKGNNSMAMYISNTNFKLDDVICSIIVRGGENIQVTFIQNQTFLVEKVASMKGFELLFRKVF